VLKLYNDVNIDIANTKGNIIQFYFFKNKKRGSRNENENGAERNDKFETACVGGNLIKW